VTVMEWSSDAPHWRIARPGLCMEGPCSNKDCEAYSKMVICNRGNDTSFVFGNSTCHCPMCRCEVVATTCGFNNCFWRYKGEKIDKVLKKRIYSEGEFVKVGDNYTRFSESSDNMVTWHSLQIIVSTDPNKVSFGSNFFYKMHDNTCVCCLEDMHLVESASVEKQQLHKLTLEMLQNLAKDLYSLKLSDKATKDQIVDEICKSKLLSKQEQQHEPVQKLQCGHYFHRDCISNWLSRSRTCPYCRCPVSQ
jgi:hypothetical protein